MNSDTVAYEYPDDILPCGHDQQATSCVRRVDSDRPCNRITVQLRLQSNQGSEIFARSLLGKQTRKLKNYVNPSGV